MKVSDYGMRLVCACCLEAKLARLPFIPVIERKSSCVLTSSGNRYAMTVIDGFSRFFVTYLLKNKSEAAGRLKDM